jgi:hypothetical protein
MAARWKDTQCTRPTIADASPQNGNGVLTVTVKVTTNKVFAALTSTALGAGIVLWVALDQWHYMVYGLVLTMIIAAIGAAVEKDASANR